MDVQHIPSPPPVPEEFLAAERWATEHIDELVRQYPDQWVAVLDGKVIAAAPGLDEVEDVIARDHAHASPYVTLIERNPGVYATGAAA